MNAMAEPAGCLPALFALILDMDVPRLIGLDGWLHGTPHGAQGLPSTWELEMIRKGIFLCFDFCGGCIYPAGCLRRREGGDGEMYGEVRLARCSSSGGASQRESPGS